jgi:hypothetical protein
MAKGKRARTKYPALKPELNLKSRYELIDYDYVEKLSEEDKAWLNKFTEEYVNASLDSENLENNFHCTDELKKDCYRRNNARNRDILTRAKASGTYISTDELLETKKVVKIELQSELFKEDADNFKHTDNPSDRANDDGNGSDDF